ncbi:hypothetical protein F4813DRAFT_39068 [Daldinia decipiens]|uniref:uncharacterized protein n=1 Tax=Daldinia decipiens TaxID=326647 RepID=UPI0020C3F9DC|nr:uncharacterized protein F4813DRAFT_39068 [Daldinia decipiens]KAI1658591.1 hypothetical protein F4813DRAFT_39068 [Daldinia decipiens]
MKGTRYSTSRQKACQPCSTAKAKCDRKARCCTRCALRGLSCSYPQTLLSRASSRDVGDNVGDNIGDSTEAGLYNSISDPRILSAASPGPEIPTRPGTQSLNSQSPTSQSLAVGLTQASGSMSPTNTSSATFVTSHTLDESILNITGRASGSSEVLDFSSLELFSPIDVDGISNRWLNTYIPIPGQKVKEYPATITAFIYRLLKSYATVAVRGRSVPPFVHHSQISVTSTRPPLSTCLSLVRICENPLPGSESVAADVLQREMNNIYEQQGTYDDFTLLAAFQAYLIYSMVLFFKLNQVSGPFLRQAIMNLQDLACSSSRSGLVCIAEQQRARPRWEAWIVAEAKRRALFTMYLFDSVLSTQDGLQTFLGTELQGLPASADKSLWRAQIRRDWEIAYNMYLADWPKETFRIDELWPIAAGLDEPSLLERRNRVDRWLENVDEFGTMLYAVTSCTHGG